MIHIQHPNSTKLLVTLAVGEQFLLDWQQWLKSGWEIYAKKHGYDIVVFTEVLDNSSRAQQRSISWQKCLILNQAICQQYQRVVWVDSDVLINPSAPCIAEQVPLDKVGATDAYSFISKTMHDYLYECYIDYCKKRNKQLVINPTAASYYQNFGIDTDLNEVIQAGILVLNPIKHRSILNKVYEDYEEKYDAELDYAYNYEMRPLSYEIVKRDLHYFIDQRFNFILNNYMYLAYPFLCHTENFLTQNHVQQEVEQWMRLAVTSAYSHAYFLHFAGGAYWKSLIKYVNLAFQNPTDFDLLTQLKDISSNAQ
ncbi:MAG: hypothetical protein GY810_06160 [Aureispira sp.]|nr:hypothetical protein [Aureispira sp.]